MPVFKLVCAPGKVSLKEKMSKILIKNIKGLVQVGEDLPNIRMGKDMQTLPILENAFLALEDGEVIATTDPNT